MTVPPYVLVIVLIVFGFLTSSTVYFYNRSRVETVSGTQSQKVSFNGQIPKSTEVTPQDKALTELTKPDAPKGRLSYPANVYTVQPKETLFGIGKKFGLSWQLIMKANGLTNENIVQADYALVIPALDHNTDYYRVNMTLNQEVATTLNQELRNASSSEYFDPVKVAKKAAVPYFGVTVDDSFSLSEQDLSKGTAAVSVKSGDELIAVVGLFQPKVKGAKGLWTVLYVEQRS